MDVSENSGNPKSSILIGFSIINYVSILGYPYFLETAISTIYAAFIFESLGRFGG